MAGWDLHPLKNQTFAWRTMINSCFNYAFTIVIPALNEEEAIAGTIQRCLDSREAICRAAALEEVEIIVVSDGSTDQTAAIAGGFDEVRVIIFEQNRGYGAAIKEGFRQGQGQLVGFIDADGTCDPHYFAEMCRVIVEDGADIALGSRLGPGTKMPAIRKLGNRIFAVLLGILCGRQVLDTASGMRVLRRSTLGMLYPLPDRLHFTPSMSARALLNGLRIVEIPMSYEERIGTSKLSVLGDGVRFLRTILSGVLCYRPERIFLLGFVACALIVLPMAMYPAEYYFRNHSLQEWMIYRFVVCFLLAVCGWLMLGAAGFAHRMALGVGPRTLDGVGFWPPIIAKLFEGKALVFQVTALGLAAFGFLGPGIIEYTHDRTSRTSLVTSDRRDVAATLSLSVADYERTHAGRRDLVLSARCAPAIPTRAIGTPVQSIGTGCRSVAVAVKLRPLHNPEPRMRPGKNMVAFDRYAENYDAALDRGLSASGEGKEYFARGRVEWLARRLGERSFDRVPPWILDAAPDRPRHSCGRSSASIS